MPDFGDITLEIPFRSSLKPYRYRFRKIITYAWTRDGKVECALKKLEEQSTGKWVYVAPQISPVSGLPYHEWFIEFENEPEDDAVLRKR
jgi:hypothetical protein